MRAFQDFEYTNDTGEHEEHFADADGDDDFKSVTNDFEQRHAEGEAAQRLAHASTFRLCHSGMRSRTDNRIVIGAEEARVVAAMEDRQRAHAAAERARKVLTGAEDAGTAEDAGVAGGVSPSANEAAPGSRHAPAERTAASQSNKSEVRQPSSPLCLLLHCKIVPC